jgi:hypothetical protein
MRMWMSLPPQPTGRKHPARPPSDYELEQVKFAEAVNAGQ